jgi:predicted nucleotidyltransferase
VPLRPIDPTACVEQSADRAAEALNDELRGLLGRRVISFILHGSAVLGDLAPGYSDLDFLAVLADDLSEADRGELQHLRRPFLAGEHDPWGRALEGAFLPRPMLDPAVKGRAYWWGTSGERPWDSNKLGWFTLWVIRERGRVLWGQDVRGDVPAPPEAGLAAQVTEFCASARQHAKGGGAKSVDWLLTAARLLKWVREGVMSSKTDGADWALRHATGRWRESLPLARDIRLHTELAETDEVKAWLRDIRAPIGDACDELEAALAARLTRQG